ncbi:Tripartite tricarboxylate transporter substrate binding protein [Cupriavidus necator]|uniref:Tripartite tricarboxylate transporter substrate binding protein n=2 Tax=Cupriavidus necator (strain ATCC 17699 / DSM 428 / KCTC 22496 / NCIMB 10442 / H16 / Stanier 337) TaxID=381666 RepID=A0AAE5ZL60_CUPNH|nr:tripartite tricarboxylate transporter substrate binding protein [Cupriavidus necator]QCC03095.1 tripartite tricarboxylate transporter substrate binding protein [Cupriavidus necator H16]QQB80152.1 tripartite tricarboxylate transporter substrate binding protein [Cupriavidus necator]WKA44411.1 tripartite tricarboxylate transporter substrate binding protein [Cupriavidus necator]
MLMKQKKALLPILALAWSAAVMAQAYPGKPVTLILPSAPGGLVDTIGRAYGDEFTRRTGQPVVVVNKPGASGALGTLAAARAAPDGYTLLMAQSTAIFNVPLTMKKVPYEVRRDFAFITQVSAGTLVLAVNAAVPARNLQEFVAWAKNNRDKVNYGSYGVGSNAHLVIGHLNSSRGLEMSHIPYPSEMQDLQGLAGGSVQLTIASAGALAPYVASGKIRPLAVVGDTRLPAMPDVPTMAEAGFSDPEFRSHAWIVLMAPAGIPPNVQAFLEKTSREIIRSTPLKARFQAYGFEPMGNSSAEFRQNFEAALPVIGRLIKLSGAREE